LSFGNASERWWRLWRVEVWPALYFRMAMKSVWSFFEKVGQKVKTNIGKEEISEIPIGYVEIGSREIK
jgi:hypothetical protein